MVDICKIFSSSSWALKTCAVVLGIVFIVQCVGIGTLYWNSINIHGSKYHSGLWKHCLCYRYTSYNYYNDENCFCGTYSIPGWQKGVAALEVTGLIAIIIIGFMIFSQLFCTQSISIKIWGIILTFFAGVCILAGVALYGAMIVHNLNFSFGLCVVAAILCFVCTFFLIQDRRISVRNAQSPGQVQYSNQGQIIQSPQAQVVIGYSNQTQQPLYPPSYAHAQYGPPPSYLVAQQQGQFVQQQSQLVPQYGQCVQQQNQIQQTQQKV